MHQHYQLHLQLHEPDKEGLGGAARRRTCTGSVLPPVSQRRPDGADGRAGGRGSGSSPGGWKEESESLEADSDSKFK
uniref:Uncharacterized protein n=1 Tax=Globodera pallida TaxID=36090 RepID=A0A183CRE4_GLOPA